MPRKAITRRQRESIYRQLRRHLTTVDDIRVVADYDPDEAGRLGLHYADDFRLFEDVGWDRDNPRDSIRLTMPPTDLRRVLMRLQAEAEGALATTKEEREEKAHAETREEHIAARAKPVATSSTPSTQSSKVGARAPAPETSESQTENSDPLRWHASGPLTTRRQCSSWSVEEAFRAVAPGGRLMVFGVAPSDRTIRLSPYRIYREEIT